MHENGNINLIASTSKGVGVGDFSGRADAVSVQGGEVFAFNLFAQSPRRTALNLDLDVEVFAVFPAATASKRGD